VRTWVPVREPSHDEARAYRVVVAHADADVRAAVTTALRRAAFVVREAGSSSELQRAIDELRPDLVAIDVARAGTAWEAAERVLTFADVVLDERTHEVARAGQALELTRLEFELLRFFLLNPRRVVSRAQILEAVWGRPYGDAGVVETYVGYLRRKLGEPRLVHTIRGVGYVLRPPPAEEHERAA
jgi:DNA-binding response OmpR family regulator